jgi:hypothetical protein
LSSTYRGTFGFISIQPPAVRRSASPIARWILGELGTLGHAQVSVVDPGTCFIAMTHDDFYFLGELRFDDHEFCSRVYGLLKANLGRSILEIGSLDIP